MKKLKVLELFAGSRSIGKVAEQRGHEVFSTDINDFDGIDLAADIVDVMPSDIPFVPDVIWASPPCTSYSIAAISHHRNGQVPKSDFAKKSDEMIAHVHYLIDYFTKQNPNVVYFMENPRGMLRKMDFMSRHDQRHTVTYCQYGDTRMKPTDIWTNSTSWIPRPMCKNGAPCHVSAPRGSRTGTQGLKGNYERSKIPPQLCEEVVKSCENI